jgi:exopolyphosphatase/guanosine-5'-triphosphate,3'-diphosphate pyrophosphatase
MKRTLECLKRYSEKVIARGLEPSSVICVATSQARDAKNSHEFFSTIQKDTGFVFRVLSGQDEARYTFLGGLRSEMNPESSCVIDIGGGSTELISLRESHSLDIGSVRFTERFLKSDPVTDAEFWTCQDAVDEELQKLVPWRKKLKGDVSLVAVAGTATTLAAWFAELKKFDSQVVDSVVLTRGDLHRMVEELKWRSVAEKCQLPCMEPKRADVILAGALILWRALEVLDFPSCQISTRGLRYGVMVLK